MPLHENGLEALFIHLLLLCHCSSLSYTVSDITKHWGDLYTFLTHLIYWEKV